MCGKHYKASDQEKGEGATFLDFLLGCATDSLRIWSCSRQADSKFAFYSEQKLQIKVSPWTLYWTILNIA